MADNLVLSAGTEDGATIATDDITSVHYPISKLAHGALESATLVSTSSGLPVAQQGTWNVTEASGSAIATDLAAIEVLLTTLNSLITTIDGVLDAIDAGKLEEATFTGRIGEAQDSPTQYTVLERLKVIATALAGTLTVSGTVDLGATDNAVLDNIDADLTTIIGHVDGLETLIGTTNTTLSTIDGRVDGIEGLLTTIDADTGNLAAILTALQTIDNMISGNEAQVDVVAALPAGNNNIGDVDIASIAAGDNNIGNVDVVTLPALPAGTNNIGDVDVLSIAAGTNTIGDVGVKPRTSGGLTTAMFSGSDGSSILVATAQVVKASAGQLFGYYAYNPEAAVSFVHFYNTAAASVTVGTTNPLFTLPIPAGSAANLMSDIGIVFSNAGWSVAATTTAGGNTAPATGVSLVVWYA